MGLLRIFALSLSALFAVGNASNSPIFAETPEKGHMPFILQSVLQTLLPRPHKFGSAFEDLILEIPTYLALLSEFGDDVKLPSYFGRGRFLKDEYEMNVRNPRLLNASSLAIGAFVSGRTLTFTVSIPSAVLLCPECSYQNVDSDFGQSYKLYIEDYTDVLSDLKISLSADLTERPFGNYEEAGALAIENITTSFSIQECSMLMRKVLRVWENGTEETFSDYKEDYAEAFTLGYAEEKDYLSRMIGEQYVNCFLGGHDGILGCLWYYRGQSYRHQAFSQISHLLGLAAARKAPEFSKPISEITDPFVKMNKVLFYYGTYLIETVKYMTAFEFWEEDGPNIMDVYFDKTSTNCSTDETSCDTFRNIVWNGGKNTTVNGLIETEAFAVVHNYTIDYEYKLPNLVINCKDFMRESLNLGDESLLVYDGLEFAIANARFGLVGGFTSDENGMIQLVNSDFQFSLFQANMYFPSAISYEQGSREDLSPLTVDFATEIVNLWESKDENGVTFQQRYSQYLEKIINDFLAGKVSI